MAGMSPQTQINDWLQFDASQPKRKRAELVCTLCHSKKIKCDLQSQNQQGQDGCTNCLASDKACHVRRSKRAKRPQMSKPRDGQRTPRTRSGALALATEAMDIQIDPVLESLHTAPEDGPADPGVPYVQLDDAGPSLPSWTLKQSAPAQQPARAATTSPSQQSLDSAESQTQVVSESQNGDIDTGFLQIYNHEADFDAQKQKSEATALQKLPVPAAQDQELMESFLETYWEYCYPWCPVLDRETIADELPRSPLLSNALATAASHIRPPLVPHRGPAEYYKSARDLFYSDEEVDGLSALKSIALFYWWAPRAPSIVHRHSSWWWTSVLIRHAQQMNLHREPAPSNPRRASLSPSLRRRIWWTAFARERLTALCQSKPAIIDPDDCNVRELCLDDFPRDSVSQHKGNIFIHWVRLCGIVGRVAKTLYRIGYATASATASPAYHMHELADWINSLPSDLQLQIQNPRTQRFDRDVHQLHLPYLTTVIILNLKRSEHPLPQVLPPAILAASCIARILRDILARGDTRFLMAITCWYSGTAFIPLLQATRIPHLAKHANECIDILESTVEQLQDMWDSANVIRQGFSRLRSTANELLTPEVSAPDSLERDQGARESGHVSGTFPAACASSNDDFDWTTLFPFVTRQTSSIADSLLADREQGIITTMLPSDDSLFNEALMTQFDDLFVQCPDYGLDFITAV